MYLNGMHTYQNTYGLLLFCVGSFIRSRARWGGSWTTHSTKLANTQTRQSVWAQVRSTRRICNCLFKSGIMWYAPVFCVFVLDFRLAMCSSKFTGLMKWKIWVNFLSFKGHIPLQEVLWNSQWQPEGARMRESSSILREKVALLSMLTEGSITCTE